VTTGHKKPHVKESGGVPHWVPQNLRNNDESIPSTLKDAPKFSEKFHMRFYFKVNELYIYIDTYQVLWKNELLFYEIL
jgi:hypothetical protein